MKEPYVQINIILGIVLVLLFSYSFFYPVLARKGLTLVSSCKGLPEAFCRSRGLSRAFAALVRGKTEQARKLNPYSISIFGFFSAQLAGRFLFSFLFLKLRRNSIIYFDIVASAGYFLLVFSPMVLPR